MGCGSGGKHAFYHSRGGGNGEKIQEKEILVEKRLSCW